MDAGPGPRPGGPEVRGGLHRAGDLVPAAPAGLVRPDGRAHCAIERDDGAIEVWKKETWPRAFAQAEGHELGGGLAGDSVAGPESCRLRNGITREATRSGSSSIIQWPWPVRCSTWADGNAWRWRSACS